VTRAARPEPLTLSWSEAHRLAGAGQLAPRDSTQGSERRLAVGPGPVAYVGGSGHGAGAIAQLADALAASLGVAAVAIHEPEAELLGTVGAALAVASGDDAIALADALAAGPPRRRPVLAVASGSVRKYFSRALLGRRRIVCGVGYGDSSRRALAVAEELAERLGAELEAVRVEDGAVVRPSVADPARTLRRVVDDSVGAGLRRAVAGAGASLVVVGSGPAARELIAYGGAPVVLA
jgi:hypothetical protein